MLFKLINPANLIKCARSRGFPAKTKTSDGRRRCACMLLCSKCPSGWLTVRVQEPREVAATKKEAIFELPWLSLLRIVAMPLTPVVAGLKSTARLN
jgi:hypothetical protein